MFSLLQPRALRLNGKRAHRCHSHRSMGAIQRSLYTRPPMTEAEVIKRVMASPKDNVKLAAIDIDGIPRGKYVSKEKFLSAVKSGSTFCSVIFGWDCNDQLYDNTKVTGWHMGYSDFPTSIDIQTFREVPYEDNVPFFLMDFVNKKDGKVLEVCPRGLLKKVIKDVETELSLKPLVGCEYEFFTFKETSQSLKDKNYLNPKPLTPGMFGYSLLRTGANREFFWSLMDNLKKFGVSLEALHTETGPGVLEAALEYSNALEAADQAVLFKMIAKDIGRDFGIMPTFMAKPHSDLPGSGGHMHESLNDSSGKNAFYDEKDEFGMSQMMKHFVAGQMHCLPELMPMYAPTINSYKRLVEGYWAPTTPTWGVENRTVSFRVIPAGKAIRSEVRIPGADVNPYLGIAASVASGLYGIKHKLPLKPQVTGTAYKPQPTSDRERLPRNLGEAADRMAKSDIAKEILGEVFVEHFAATRTWEWRQSQKSVTNWEIERYLEII